MSLFTDKPEIFKNKAKIDTDTLPEEFPAREPTLKEYKEALYPVYKGERPKNLFITGGPGTGKTAMTKYVVQRLAEDADDPIHPVYVNCQSIDNDYQLAREIANGIRKQRNQNYEAIPAKGYSKADVLELLFEEINGITGTIMIIIDEIDNVNNIENLLYEIPRARSTERIEADTNPPGIIGISNRTDYLSNISSKTKDTLNDISITFETYNADDLKEILNARADEAFYDVLESGVIQLCAARASQDTSSARRALDLLRTAGEIARSSNDQVVRTEHVREAEERLERNHVRDFVKTTDDQTKWALVSLLIKECAKSTPARTSAIYEEYENMMYSMSTLSYDRFRQRLNKLEDRGIVNSKTKTDDGRYSQFQLISDLEMTISALPSSGLYASELLDVLAIARETNVLSHETIKELEDNFDNPEESKSE